MAGQSITLHLPDELYRRVKEEADRTRRSVEEELIDVVASVLPGEPTLPDDLATAVEHLDLLDNVALERAARSHLSRKSARRLENLHLKRQREGLEEAETREVESLVRQYERAMLVRAHALRLLKRRGHDVATFVQGA